MSTTFYGINDEILQSIVKKGHLKDRKEALKIALELLDLVADFATKDGKLYVREGENKVLIPIEIFDNRDE